MTTRKPSLVPPEKLKLYQQLIALLPEIHQKANFGAAYTAINGNMFSMISKYGVVGLRLPENDRNEFIIRYKTTVFRADPKWPPNKEYVAVPDALLSKRAQLLPYLRSSFEYAKSLKPKPTKRKE